jgi:hypothetical protein
MLRFLAKPRFNHIDTIALVGAVVARDAGAEWWVALIWLVVGLVLSVWAEIATGQS